MKKEVIENILFIFSRARSQLVYDFLNHSPDIYEPCFKYEKKHSILKMSIEKKFITWIDMQSKLIVEDINLKYIDEDQEFFIDILIKLQKSCGVYVGELKCSELANTLLIEKIGFLNRLLEEEIALTDKLNLVKYQMEKDNALFSRNIENLKS